jgi:hypothetical protein
MTEIAYYVKYKSKKADDRGRERHHHSLYTEGKRLRIAGSFFLLFISINFKDPVKSRPAIPFLFISRNIIKILDKKQLGGYNQ